MVIFGLTGLYCVKIFLHRHQIELYNRPVLPGFYVRKNRIIFDWINYIFRFWPALARFNNIYKFVFILENTDGVCKVFDRATETLKSCQFPFIFQNQTYYGCTTDTDENGKAWCSTKISPLTNEHIPKGSHWGYCLDDSKNCPFADDAKSDLDDAIKAQEGKSHYVKMDFYPEKMWW